MTTSRSYTTIPGLFTLVVPELAFRKIISVKRQGTGYDKIETGLPGNRQVLYGVSTGRFTFVNAFEGVDSNSAGSIFDIIGEKIFILWDE